VVKPKYFRGFSLRNFHNRRERKEHKGKKR
jgi:hypothetical protein